MPTHRARAKREVVPSNALIEAIRFAAVAAKDIGPPNETHVRLGDNWATMFDGVIATGHRINDALLSCPHALRFVAALERCGTNLSMVQLDRQLSVKSDKFKALIPCVDPYMFAPPRPDEAVANITDKLRDGFQAIGGLVLENSSSVATASVLLQSGSMLASEGHILLEYWHGIDLPPGLALPKVAVLSLVKKAKRLARFGFTPGNSATFHFDDESWLRTQLFQQKWPDVRHILDVPANPWPVPADFFKAVDVLAPFSDDGNLRCASKGILRTHDDENAGASYEVYGLPEGQKFSIKMLKTIQPFVKTIDFAGPNGAIYFFSDNVRGVLTAMR